MTKLAQVAAESTNSLDKIVEEAKLKSGEEMAAMQPQQPQNPNAQQPVASE
jgi:hypothetical protein